MTLAAECLLEIQNFFPTADARTHNNPAEIFVPLPYRPIAPLVLGEGPDFDIAGIRAVVFLGDNNKHFAAISKIYPNWCD
jgi:hypothetical protein